MPLQTMMLSEIPTLVLLVFLAVRFELLVGKVKNIESALIANHVLTKNPMYIESIDIPEATEKVAEEFITLKKDSLTK